MRDASILMTAVSEFLMNDARPQLADPRLAFRALIAGNLARLVAANLAVDEKLEQEATTRLQALLPSTPGDRAALEAHLARLLRQDALDPAAFAAARSALVANLAAQLAVDNPLFDLTTPKESP